MVGKLYYLCFHSGYGLGVGVYKHHFQFGFMFEKSKLISSQDDVDEFINVFDKEVEYLYAVAKPRSNVWNENGLLPKRGSSSK